MTDEKKEELKYMAFCQAGFMRLFAIKGDIVRIECEVLVHEKSAPKWADMAENPDEVEDFIRRDIKVEYLRELVGALRLEVEQLGASLELASSQSA